MKFYLNPSKNPLTQRSSPKWFPLPFAFPTYFTDFGKGNGKMKIALIFALKATKSTSNYPLNITPSTHIRKFHHKIIKNNNNTKTPEVKLVAKIKEISSLITKKKF